MFLWRPFSFPCCLPQILTDSVLYGLGTQRCRSVLVPQPLYQKDFIFRSSGTFTRYGQLPPDSFCPPNPVLLNCDSGDPIYMPLQMESRIGTHYTPTACCCQPFEHHWMNELSDPCYHSSLLGQFCGLFLQVDIASDLSGINVLFCLCVNRGSNFLLILQVPAVQWSWEIYAHKILLFFFFSLVVMTVYITFCVHMSYTAT